MAIKWREQFSCGHEEIDTQHKRLFEIGGSLQDLVSAREELDQYDAILRIVEELKAYTLYHFSFEEDLMRRIGYPETAEHKRTHEAFIAQVLKFEREDLDANQRESVLQMVLFVTDWVANHILQEDMKYRPFLKQ